MAEAERLAVEALDAEDADALAALEARLSASHHQTFPRGQRPIVAASPTPTVDEALEARHVAAMTAAGLQRRSERRAKAKGGHDKRHAELPAVRGFLAASTTAARVRDGYQQAVADSMWRALEAHDATAVIATLDTSFAQSGRECICVDAGRTGTHRRAYATVVVRVPGPEVVPDPGPTEVAAGRHVLQARGLAEREDIYRRVLASAAVAAVKQVLAAAVATDDVNVVLVRSAVPRDVESVDRPPTLLEGLHVARLTREEVTLRPVDADDVSLVFRDAAARLMLERGATPEATVGETEAELEALVGALNRALST